MIFMGTGIKKTLVSLNLIIELRCKDSFIHPFINKRLTEPWCTMFGMKPSRDSVKFSWRQRASGPPKICSLLPEKCLKEVAAKQETTSLVSYKVGATWYVLNNGIRMEVICVSSRSRLLRNEHVFFLCLPVEYWRRQSGPQNDCVIRSTPTPLPQLARPRIKW